MYMGKLPAYVGPLGRIWHYTYLALCALVFFFLIMPILVVVPLSFNAEPYFTFSAAMVRLDPDAFSLRWYQDVLGMGGGTGSNRGHEWAFAARNSIFIAVIATLLATTLGTLAAVGLSRSHMPFKGPIMAILISPMIVPIIITAAGMFFFYSKLDLAYSHAGVILAHTAIGTPFVVITVTATLVGFDHSLTRAAASLGAKPTTTVFKVIMPLILPGVISTSLCSFGRVFITLRIVLTISSDFARLAGSCFHSSFTRFSFLSVPSGSDAAMLNGNAASVMSLR